MLALCVFPIVFLLAPILLLVMREVSLACSQYGGGGVYSYGAGVLTMTSCTVSHNTATWVRPRLRVVTFLTPSASPLFSLPLRSLSVFARLASLSLSPSPTHTLM